MLHKSKLNEILMRKFLTSIWKGIFVSGKCEDRAKNFKSAYQYVFYLKVIEPVVGHLKIFI